MHINPFFSVIIPVYNAEKYISRCIDSVLQQSFTDFELICIDDGSTDNSREILEQFVKSDGRVKVYHIENSGIAKARNLGLGYANGKYVYYMDSDDWIERTLLEDVFDKYSGLLELSEIIITDFYRDMRGKNKYIHALKGVKDGDIENIKSYECFSKYFLSGYRVVWNRFILRSFLMENGSRFIELFHADDVLFCAEIYSFASKISYMKIAGYHYCFNEMSISNKYIGKSVTYMLRNLYDEEKKLETKFVDIDYIKIINTSLVNAIINVAMRYVYNSKNKMKLGERNQCMKQLMDSYPFKDAIYNFDFKYLNRSTKAFMLGGRVNFFMLKVVCVMKMVIQNRYMLRKILICKGEENEYTSKC